MEFHMPHMPHIPHPHLENRQEAFLKAKQEANNLNSQLAVKITNIVGTMWCAYAFAALALISFPAALRAGTAPLVAWFAQTFLQLVLLSIIMVGQKVAAAKSDKQLEQTYLRCRSAAPDQRRDAQAGESRTCSSPSRSRRCSTRTRSLPSRSTS